MHDVSFRIAGDVLFIPASTVTFERHLNKTDVYGLRETVVVNPRFAVFPRNNAKRLGAFLDVRRVLSIHFAMSGPVFAS